MFRRFNYFFSNFFPTFIGIYIIFNTFHGIAYIGMTTNFGPRVVKHRNDFEAKRHDCELFQNHFTELIEKNLDPFKYIYIYPIFKWEINSIFQEKVHQELVNRLKKLEKVCIRFFIDRKIPVYNVDGTDTSTTQNIDPANNSGYAITTKKFKDDDSWLYNQLSSSLNNSKFKLKYEELFKDLPKNAVKPVKVLIPNLGIFKTMRDAAHALNMDFRILDIALKSGRFDKYYHYISQEQYQKESKKSSISIPNANTATCIRILDTESPYFGQVFYGARNYAKKIGMHAPTFYNRLKNKNFATKYQVISFQEFLINSPSIDTLIQNKDQEDSLALRRARYVHVVGIGVFNNLRDAANSVNMNETTLNRYLIAKKNVDKYHLITVREYQIILQAQQILSNSKKNNNI